MVNKQPRKVTFRIEKRGNKLFKVRNWDDLNFKQYKIVSRSISLGGMTIFKKNKTKYINKVKRNKLQDYVIGREVKKSKRR